MGLSGAAFEQAKVALLREELRLLQRFADTYRRRDSSSAAQFQLDVEDVDRSNHQILGGLQF